MFKKLDVLSMLHKHRKYFKRQTECLEIKTLVSEMKITLDGNNGRLDIVEEKINELKFTTIKLSKKKCREKEKKKHKKRTEHY